jgi:hypothetical protein
MGPVRQARWVRQRLADFGMASVGLVQLGRTGASDQVSRGAALIGTFGSTEHGRVRQAWSQEVGWVCVAMAGQGRAGRDKQSPGHGRRGIEGRDARGVVGSGRNRLGIARPVLAGEVGSGRT